VRRRWIERQHPRDNRGRWVERLSTQMASSRDPFEGVVTGREAFRAVPDLDTRADNDSNDERGRRLSRAITMYVGNNFKNMNESLREGRSSSWGDTDRQVADLASALRRYRLRQDVLTYRGVYSGDRAFGDLWAKEDMTGVEWSDRGFFSTSVREDEARKHTRRGALMRVKIPAGTGAGRVGPWDEAEVLLPPGTQFRVVADHGMQDGVRRLDVEVVGQ
jgi:hypothetical protein